MKRIVLISLVAVAFVACKDAISPTDTGLETANFEIKDGSTDGNVEVFFLPPLVVNPAGDPNFDDGGANPDLEGEVVAKICETDGTSCLSEQIGADLPMSLSGEHYRVNWRTRNFGGGLTNGTPYRIQIFLGDALLASRDVLPVSKLNKKAASCSSRDVDFCQFKTGRNGANLPIKVRIESAAVCIALDAGFDPAGICGAASYDLATGDDN